MASTRFRKLALTVAATLALAGCQDGAQPFGFLKKGDTAGTATDQAAGATDQAGADAAAKPESSVKFVDRDVEAPDVFQVTDKGLWDGRPSLGGVWAAYPGVTDPERVIIRNPANGKFVIGALFRRELNNPGPKLQMSSDAASALGLLAGQPATVSVTALRREEAPVPQPAAKPAPEPATKTAAKSTDKSTDKTTAKPAATAAAAPAAKPVTPVKTVKNWAAKSTTTNTASQKIEAKPLDQVTAVAGAAIAKATAKQAPTLAAAKTAPAPAVTGKSFLQIGIFSVEANANRAAGGVSKAGAAVQVKKEVTQGKPFWRVVAGPATTAGARTALLGKVRALGYSDAYFVSK